MGFKCCNSVQKRRKRYKRCNNRPWATRNPPPPCGFFKVVIFEASEYGPIEIRLFAFKLLGLNMLKYAN